MSLKASFCINLYSSDVKAKAHSLNTSIVMPGQCAIFNPQNSLSIFRSLILKETPSISPFSRFTMVLGLDYAMTSLMNFIFSVQL